MHPESTLTVLIAEDNLIPALEIEDIVRDLGCQVVGPVGKLSEVIRSAGLERGTRASTAGARPTRW